MTKGGIFVASVRERVRIGNKDYVWISGDELVRKVGEELVNEEINGNGYSAQLKRFIAERDRKLQEEALAKAQRKEARTPKKPHAPEPGEEE